MYNVIIMIAHVGGGPCLCCHIGLGAVDPNHDLTASPWLPSTESGQTFGYIHYLLLDYSSADSL